eukprot:m51a1_g9748 putative electron transferring flavoprotein dehydrogenase (576) ;mRNA; r:1580712-1583672
MSGGDCARYDVVVVGAGPAGLSTAIRLSQLSAAGGGGRPLRVAVLEKAPEVGRHLLSGCVLEPRALDELLPAWRSSVLDPATGTPPRQLVGRVGLRRSLLCCESGVAITPVARDTFHLNVSRSIAVRLPVPLSNARNYVISLGSLCRWLARVAESMGVDILPGFGATEAVLSSNGSEVCGVRAVGGTEISAPLTILAEGCRGHITKSVVERFGLRNGRPPQTHGLGIKEVWRLPKGSRLHEPGRVSHSVGVWPSGHSTWSGAFEYHAGGPGDGDLDRLVHVGLVVGLDYSEPTRDPFGEFQELKRSRRLSALLRGAERVEFGARALADGGITGWPQLWFPGGAIIGCAAGMQNVAKIKGVHIAIKSGMLAAEAAYEALRRKESAGTGAGPVLLKDYEETLRGSWAGKELRAVRNLRPSFGYAGLLPFMGFSAVSTFFTRGHEPFTLKPSRADHQHTAPAQSSRVIHYSRPDGKLTFDRPSSVALSGTMHPEDQEPHLVLKDPARQPRESFPRYDGMEERFCPAGVYEWVREGEGAPKMLVHSTNCVHCKTCDIKDPLQNIRWTMPASGGPSYKYV